MSFSSKAKEYREEFISQSEVVTKTDSYFISTYVNLNNKDFSPEGFSGQFIPGKIYIFRYNPKSTNGIEKNGFINRMPILLVFEVRKYKDLNNVLYGVDLIATPPDERAKILERIYDYSKETIESNIEMSKKSGSQLPINLSGDNVKGLLQGTGYAGSLNGFTVSSISDPYIVDYADWVKIPYLSMALIQGSSPNEIYNQYRSKLKDSSNLQDKKK
jgi:hypothetical protein